MARSESPPICFRLRGELDGTVHSFVVDGGSHLVGSDPGADVILPTRGVSRRHARLDVGADGIEVHDLDSKNGTHLNGERVADGLALVGDELRFGPVGLRIEVAEVDDARMGVWLEPPSTIDEAEPLDETTWMSRSGHSTGEIRLELLDAILDRLDGLPEIDLDGILHLVSGHLGALGAAFVEWPRRGGAVSLAASGAVGWVPEHEALPAPRSGHRRWSPLEVNGDPPLDGVVLHRRHGALGLLIWSTPRDAAEVRDRQADADLLALVLRLLACFRPRPLVDDSDEAPVADDPLRLPAGIVRGESPAMVALYQQMTLLLRSDAPVLVLGETGVGKEHLAQTLHDSSTRCSGPFVAVNCAAIPSELLEAEMFGIGKGVATGVQSRRGKFSEAHGGTLFLDEIGDMPAQLQAKLLRALQEKQIHPLGRSPESVDVRVLSATNTNLRQRIADGKFREDLYYRLAGYTLRVPPLRERLDDLPRLVGYFLRLYSRETSKTIKGMSLEALRRMADYPWHGNIRELQHEVRRLVYVCPAHQAIDSEMLSPEITAPITESTSPASRPAGAGPPEVEAALPASPPADPLIDLRDRGLTEHLHELEARLLRQALRRTAGNQSRAAKLLRISRNGLAQRLRRHEIDPADFRV
ncbi:MAG: sigma 54-interacting transcriptional regulator [Acidobacteriota bacterium]